MDVDLVRLWDYLADARGHMFTSVRSQPPDVYTRRFPFGLGSIRATLLHIAAAEWAYVERLRGRDHPLADSPFAAERLPTVDALESAWGEQAALTRTALATLGDPRRPVEFISRVGPRPVRARATAGEIVIHMALHEVHHRSQVMAMLRHAGVRAENLDYSILAFMRASIDG